VSLLTNKHTIWLCVVFGLAVVGAATSAQALTTITGGTLNVDADVEVIQ
jgi:hypothetical protein